MKMQPRLKPPTEKFAVRYGMVHHDLVKIHGVDPTSNLSGFSTRSVAHFR